MVTCCQVTNLEEVVAYLRQDVLANNPLIVALERNIPSVPRTVWAANQADGTTVGVMLVEQFPGWVCAELEVRRPEAIPTLVHCLNRHQQYRFVMREGSWEHLLAELDDATPPSHNIAMTVSPDGLRPFFAAGKTRTLAAADMHLADRFPDPESRWRRSLSSFVESAGNNPQAELVFGVLLEGEIVSCLALAWVIDDIWEVRDIRTRDEHRRKGFAKAVLSHATSHLLQQGDVPLYEVDADNLASLRTAQAVGYREVFRTFWCTARVRSGKRV